MTVAIETHDLTRRKSLLVTVDVHISASVRTHVGSGTRADVHIDGYEQAFPARVRWVAADAAFTPYFALSQYDRSRLSYVAEIDLIGDDIDQLPVGIPVEVTFPELVP